MNLKQKLTNLGLKELPVSPDGNCQFHALLKCLTLSSCNLNIDGYTNLNSYKDVRKNIIKFLNKNNKQGGLFRPSHRNGIHNRNDAPESKVGLLGTIPSFKKYKTLKKEGNFILTESWTKYLKAISIDGSWGDFNTLKACAYLYNIKIVILSNTNTLILDR